MIEFQWDADGSCRYTWNGRNELASMRRPASWIQDGNPQETLTFAYNAEGMRTFKGYRRVAAMAPPPPGPTSSSTMAPPSWSNKSVSPPGGRLVVGGGRAAGFPQLQPGDIALNIDPAALPDIIGDIRTISTGNFGKFMEIYVERLPFDAIDDIAAKNIAQILQPGGQLKIITGGAASRKCLRQVLGQAGFEEIVIDTVMTPTKIPPFEIEATGVTAILRGVK